jgi:5-methylcytosine-specific restriction endonuclease McrA
MSQILKTCPDCRRSLTPTNFSRDKQRKDGLSCYCRDCKTARQKKSYAENNEARRAAKKIYNDANRETRRLKQQKYNQANREIIAQKIAAYRRQQPESCKASKQKHYEANREKILAGRRKKRQANPWSGRRRDKAYKQRPEVKARERLRYATDSDYRERRKASLKRVIAKRRGALRTERIYRKTVHARGNGVCYLCLEPVLLADMHLEHKQPLSRGGSHTYDNVGCACRPCNMSKHNKTEAEFRQYLQELQELAL